MEMSWDVEQGCVNTPAPSIPAFLRLVVVLTALEKVRRRATRLILGLKGVSYEDRLKKTTTNTWRLENLLGKGEICLKL